MGVFGGKKSVQELLGIKTFTDYGLLTTKGELVYFQVAPTNISVLSYTSIDTKIRHLMLVLSTRPNIEIICTDSSECFDENKAYLLDRSKMENCHEVRQLLIQDREFLDNIQSEMATARQFVFVMRFKDMKPEQVFQEINRTEKIISDQGFDCHRLKKEEIKRFLALYFEASMYGETMPDGDGEQYFQTQYLQNIVQ